MYGFVTDSPLFDDPTGFQRELTHEEDIRLRASAQRAMEAGRPMTMAEMYGKPQQLFTTLRGFGDAVGVVSSQTCGLCVSPKFVLGLAAIGLIAWLAYTKLPEAT